GERDALRHRRARRWRRADLELDVSVRAGDTGCLLGDFRRAGPVAPRRGARGHGGATQSAEGGKIMRTLVTFGLGALAMYLFDPQHGRGRRSLFRDRLARARRFVARRASGATPDLSYRQYVAGK